LNDRGAVPGIEWIERFVVSRLDHGLFRSRFVGFAPEMRAIRSADSPRRGRPVFGGSGVWCAKLATL
jgi:hypothetical protein